MSSVAPMLYAVEFDQRFLERRCYRLRPTVTDQEWDQFDQLAFQGCIFADLKSPASDLSTAGHALKRSFRKICTHVELSHCLTKVEPVNRATFAETYALTNEQLRAHAEHFVTSRFRQDPAIPSQRATALYAAWITNSLSGSKRLAIIGSDFCSFGDRDGVRYIDLLSVLEKRRGYATELLRAVVLDAQSRDLKKVLVTAELENEVSLKAYKAVGFEIDAFNSIFHFHN